MSAPRRKLTTILAADVEGYSRLMEADEEGTLATLKHSQGAMRRLIEAHAGRVVNTWGDGLIAEFESVVEAVRAAIDIQTELADHNGGRPAENRMLFRIGLNLGDVICDGDDIYGDGVNIAARLQASAPPGGIVISNTVYDQVRNKVAAGFEFLGQLSVKNIAEGVPSYAVRLGEESPAPSAPRRRGPHRRSEPDDRTGDVYGLGHVDRVHEEIGRRVTRGRLAGTAVILLVIVAINLITWDGHFWAVWPMLAVAWMAGLGLAKTAPAGMAKLLMLGVSALGIVAINVITWSGHFWAVWPLLGMAGVAAFRWIWRHDPGRGKAP